MWPLHIRKVWQASGPCTEGTLVQSGGLASQFGAVGLLADAVCAMPIFISLPTIVNFVTWWHLPVPSLFLAHLPLLHAYSFAMASHPCICIAFPCLHPYPLHMHRVPLLASHSFACITHLCVHGVLLFLLHPTLLRISSLFAHDITSSSPAECPLSLSFRVLVVRNF